MKPKRRFRLYVDEAGTHGPCALETAPVGSRYLCLFGVVVELGAPYQAIASGLTTVQQILPGFDPYNRHSWAGHIRGHGRVLLT